MPWISWHFIFPSDFLLGTLSAPARIRYSWGLQHSSGISLGHFPELDCLFPNSHISLLFGSCFVFDGANYLIASWEKILEGRKKILRTWLSQSAFNLPLQLIESLAQFIILGWKLFLLEFSGPYYIVFKLSVFLLRGKWCLWFIILYMWPAFFFPLCKLLGFSLYSDVL